MKGPIVLSIVINFIIFLNILRVLFIKLNAVNSPEAKKFRYRKLAKSTLVLIPLFGVHYIVFLFLPKDVDERTELVKLYFEMFFNSIQGFFVALLFCFLNGEVQSEMRKTWARFRLSHQRSFSRAESGRSRGVSGGSTYTSYLSRARESVGSLQHGMSAMHTTTRGKAHSRADSDSTMLQQSSLAELCHSLPADERHEQHGALSNGTESLEEETLEIQPMLSCHHHCAPSNTTRTDDCHHNHHHNHHGIDNLQDESHIN